MSLQCHKAQASTRTILVVDDDEELCAQIADYLRGFDYQVLTAFDAASLDARLAEQRVDLIVLDVMMPGEDGLDICRRLRRENAPPVVMLSGMGDELDRVVGLELGADDYLVKPCRPRELLARIRAVLRRSERTAEVRPTNVDPLSAQSIIEFDGFKLHFLQRQLYAPNGALVVLSNREHSLLAVFLESPNEVLDRATLARRISIGEPTDLCRAVDMQVSRLRAKLDAHSAAQLIKTVRKQGYIFSPRTARGRLPAGANGRAAQSELHAL
jgi:two-component system OmpR family response regulator